ncbi:MAG: Flp pilus assembly complex ATPase component TadA [Lentisphaeria bacterium]|nr:Flp pilus assembly complex ATPase component TadA [Lentisphaeria bacterium]
MITKPDMDPPEFVECLLREALEANASDIYVLPGRGDVRFRSKGPEGEGELAVVPLEYGLQCVARIKVLAGMLTYRTSVAQDGAVHGFAGACGRELRVATLPSLNGERMTIRALKQGGAQNLLDDLGFAESAVQRLHALLRRRTGLLVFTGPTGSGKTTTIYAIVRELLRGGHNPAEIITIEDPVECEISGITQIQIRRNDEDWSYVHALRAALRHDVKTLVIGEMRDREVVRVALDAALTGHRVITTYHAGDIPSVYARMLHQGFEPFLVAAAVTGVVSQRLVHTDGGRHSVPIAAVLEADDPWREMIMERPPLSEIRKRLRGIPGADLATEAQALVQAGRISKTEACLL